MKTDFCLLAILLALGIPSAHAGDEAKSAGNKEKLGARIQTACLAQIEEEYANSLEICRCVSSNLETGLKEKELELITRSHEGDPGAEKELQNEKFNELILFDYEVTESCLTDPLWKGRRK